VIVEPMGGNMAYRFDAFMLAAGTRQLLFNNTEVHLTPKAFELLLLLVTNRDRAISKAELQERLWPSTFVEETNIASLVVEVRRALRDSPDAPRLVRTVYGFGDSHRFAGHLAVPCAHSGRR
jgi:DNA-binding winged helix-turn-helix (wHTH) protein